MVDSLGYDTMNADKTLFVAVGHRGVRATSPDGENWSVAEVAKEGQVLRAAACGNGVCLAVGTFGGSNLFATTRDGTEWKVEQKDAQYRFFLRGLCYGDEQFLGLGGDPGSVGASSPFVMTSRDGLDWSGLKSISGKEILRRAAWGNGRYVAVGDRGRRATSSDGLEWKDAAGVRAIDTLVDLTFGNGLFVGVGLHGLRMTTRDGVEWSQPVRGEEGEHLNTVLWTGERFVAVGLGGTWFSADGVEWRREANRNAPLTAAYGNGRYVGTAWRGRLLFSNDAVDWREVHRLPHHAEAVAFGIVQ
ncbi:MAG: hypothetical protein NT069_09850 [Planctomycetota bacterium]|nr:hypothetical protein [Planctomycetota bacterium]